MTPPARRRGAPLVLLVSVVGLWAGMRVLAWQMPFATPELGGPVLSTEADAATIPAYVEEMKHRTASLSQSVSPRVAVVPSSWPSFPQTMANARSASIAPAALAPQSARLPQLARPTAPVPFEPPRRIKETHPPRWSADAWVLIRRGGRSGLGAGLAPATYGASQAGAVLRYRLAPGSPHRPAVYLRASTSLDGPAQREAAVGLMARPIPGLPVSAAGELRVFRDASGTRLRPVATAITELAPIALPYDVRAEVYVQAGYAGGKGATAFADGQVRVDRRITGADKAELRLGAGAWGGAQEGASRLDVGPSATLTFPLGESLFGRVSADWRFRVAGDAAPTSGPALTLSAGF